MFAGPIKLGAGGIRYGRRFAALVGIEFLTPFPH